MRIKIIKKPSVARVNGMRLDVFQPGVLYEMVDTFATFLISEGWAEPVLSDEPVIVIPLRNVRFRGERVAMD